MYFELGNDDMESSIRRLALLSLIFILLRVRHGIVKHFSINTFRLNSISHSVA